MNLEDDFVKDETVELNIDGKTFKYKPTTAGQENDWLNQYMHVEGDKAVQDFAKLNELKLCTNIVSVPYDKSLIHKLIGHDKEWSELKPCQKWELFKKLKASVFDKLLKSITKYDSGDTKKKDSSTK